MITFVCFLWKQVGYRSTFTYKHVNTLYKMLTRNCTIPFELICVTNSPQGISSEIRVRPMWNDWASIPNQSWASGPSCYRRLGVFTPSFREACRGDRILCIDLDVVIAGDITPLIQREGDFLMWGTGEPKIPVCGSMFMFSNNDKYDFISTTFTGIKDAREACQTMAGSDQAWLVHSLGIDNICQWTKADGVYSFGHDLCYQNPALMTRMRVQVTHPINARIVIFNGKPDPWECLHLSWVKEHYR